MNQQPQSEETLRGLFRRAYTALEERLTNEETLFVLLGGAGVAGYVASETVGTFVENNAAVDIMKLVTGSGVAVAGIMAVAERITRR